MDKKGIHVTPNVDFSTVSDKQLYGYQKDPWETVNVSNHPQYKEIQKDLANKLHQLYNTMQQ